MLPHYCSTGQIDPKDSWAWWDWGGAASQTPHFWSAVNWALNLNPTAPCLPQGAANTTGCGGGPRPQLPCLQRDEAHAHDGDGACGHGGCALLGGEGLALCSPPLSLLTGSNARDAMVEGDGWGIIWRVEAKIGSGKVKCWCKRKGTETQKAENALLERVVIFYGDWKIMLGFKFHRETKGCDFFQCWIFMAEERRRSYITAAMGYRAIEFDIW